MSALADTLRILARTFEEYGVRWYIFGAQAVSVRGAPRATQDVDVTVEAPKGALAEITDALGRRGLSHRFPDIADELLARAAVIPLTHSESGMEVDLVVAGSGLEQLAMDRAERLAIAGVDVPVAHATDLVVMKVLAGRGKDLDDVRALLASGRVDVDEARDLLVQLERALGQSDLMPRLDEALTDVEGSWR